MRKYVVIDKKVGETPLMAIEAFRKSEPDLGKIPLTYAGRLDPMASGKLLVLIGEECKKRSSYDGLDKTYLFEVLLGFATDTGDVLGIPRLGALIGPSDEDAERAARSLIGAHTFPYPAFSSKTVNGKPLFTYALSGTLDSIVIPTTDVQIHAIRYMDRVVSPKDELIERILSRIEHLKVRHDDEQYGADFRKDETMRAWWSLSDRRKTPCTILRFEASVSSGTYIRTLAPLIAASLGTIGLAYSIRRTRVGRYLPIAGRTGLWIRTL